MFRNRNVIEKSLSSGFGIFYSGFFRDFQIQIPMPGIFGILHSGFFRGFNIPTPIPGISGSSGFFPRDFRIPIPIAGISGFSGFFDLAEIKKSRSRIPGFGIQDSGSRKNPISKSTLLMDSELSF